MKSLLKLLTRLYPSAWRNRYATEFEAMLEDTPPRARDAFDVFLAAVKMQATTWSFARITLASCLAGVLAAFAISSAIPARYVSQTLILVNPYVGATTDNTGEDASSAVFQYLSYSASDVLNRDSLTKLIEKQNLYPNERKRMPLNAVVDKMQRSIYILPLQSSIDVRSPQKTKLAGFTIQFDYPDPHVAQKVNEELLSLFIKSQLAHPEPSLRLQFRVMAEPSLPQKPSFPNRNLFEATGLLIGLAAGLTLATTIRLRRKTSAANS